MMARRRLFVHVGPPKTASTTIQRMLGGLVPELLRAGILVPRAGRKRVTGNFNHLVSSQLPSHPRHKAWANDPWTALAEEIRGSPARRCVISAEAFSRYRYRAAMDWPARIAALAEAVDAQVRVIGYVRPQHRMLESIYAQRTGWGDRLVPFDVLKAELLASGEVDWCTLFEPWRKAFGASSLVVTPLERGRLGADIRSHFLRQLGERDPPTTYAGQGHANVRPGAKTLAVARMAGMALKAAGRNPRQMRQFSVHRRLAAVLRDDAPFAPMTAEEIGEVTERFAASNARFAREYGIDDDGVLFREATLDRHRRPNVASWTDLGPGERRRARLLALAMLGVDIAPGGRTANRWYRGVGPMLMWSMRIGSRTRRRFRTLLSRRS